MQPEASAVLGGDEEGPYHLVVVCVARGQARVELAHPEVEAGRVADFRVAVAPQVRVVSLSHELAVILRRAAQRLVKLRVVAYELRRVVEGARNVHGLAVVARLVRPALLNLARPEVPSLLVRLAAE
ncbi:MAG: DUF6023 family protein, partial [Pyrinomonadaceae bacterium]